MTRITAARTAAVGAAAGGVVYFAAAFRAATPFEFDDAFMFLRYGKHFLAGHGFSWNVVDGPAYGATSALHLAAVTALRGATHLSDDAVLVASSTISALLACAVLAALGFVMLPDGALRRSWAPLLVIPWMAHSTAFLFHARSGMETMLSLLCNALVVLSAAAFVKRRSTVLFMSCVCTGYLGYLARPDNGLAAWLFPPLFFAASDRTLGKRAAVYLVVFAAVIAADAALKTWLFGDAVPLSFFAKRAGFYAGYLGEYRWNAGSYMLTFLAECAPWLVLMLAFGKTEDLPQVGAALGPVIVTFAYFLSVIQIMGFGARFYFPFVPFVLLAALVAIGRSSFVDFRAALAAMTRRRALAIAALVAVLFPPVQKIAARAWRAYMIAAPVGVAANRQYRTPAASPLPFVGGFQNTLHVVSVVEQAPDGTIVAASEYGYLGSTLDRVTILDMLGLHDRRIAHDGFSADYLLARRPDIIWFPPSDYSALIRDVLDAPAFAERYEYFPAAFEHGLALDTRSARYPAIRSVVEREFSRCYEGRSLSDYRAEPLAARGERTAASPHAHADQPVHLPVVPSNPGH